MPQTPVARSSRGTIHPSTGAVPASVVEKAFLRTLPSPVQISHPYNTGVNLYMCVTSRLSGRLRSRSEEEPAANDGGTVVEVASSAVFLAGVAALRLQIAKASLEDREEAWRRIKRLARVTKQAYLLSPRP